MTCRLDRSIIVVAALTFTVGVAAVVGQEVSVEDVAAEVARLTNLNAHAVLDDMTLAFSARASGKNVVFETVIRMRRALSPEERAKFHVKAQEMVAPLTCKINKVNEAFKRGMFYTFVYRNVVGEEVGRFSVDGDVCSSVMPFVTRRDVANGFQVDYPSNWTVVKNSTPNTKFAVVSAGGRGTCNVIARAEPELNQKTQAQLDQQVSELGDDFASWVEYMGPQVKLLQVVESGRIRIGAVRALMGVTETTVQVQGGTLVQKGMSAMAFTSGRLWVLTCGSAHKTRHEAAEHFDATRQTYDKVFQSFRFLLSSPGA